jgi:NAD(P)-dependent dehydrogenase (short-subunit alcohol dehydrogenase family)
MSLATTCFAVGAGGLDGRVTVLSLRSARSDHGEGRNVQLTGVAAVVSGGPSGLGLAAARRLAVGGADVTIIDLPESPGSRRAAEIGARFVVADVTDADQFARALAAAEAGRPLRVLVHTAGRGARVRVLERDGTPGDLEQFEAIVKLNLIGSFNALRLAAQRMAAHDLVDGERGVVVLTASVAAFEGQIGQMPYSASKAGVVGMTITAARDLASRAISVCTIAPGMFDTPLFGRLREDVQESLRATIPYPQRMGNPDEFAALAEHIIANPYPNGRRFGLMPRSGWRRGDRLANGARRATRLPPSAKRWSNSASRAGEGLDVKRTVFDADHEAFAQWSATSSPPKSSRFSLTGSGQAGRHGRFTSAPGNWG